MQLFHGYGINVLNLPVLSGEKKKREIFIYLAYRHMWIRHFPGQIEFAWHNKEGQFQQALYLKRKYPFFGIYTRKQMMDSLGYLHQESPMKIFRNKQEIIDEEYEKQYWKDVEK